MRDAAKKFYYFILTIIFYTISICSSRLYLKMFRDHKSHPYILTGIYFISYLLFIIIFYLNLPKKKKNDLLESNNIFRKRVNSIKLYKRNSIITLEEHKKQIKRKKKFANICQEVYCVKNEVIHPSILFSISQGINIYTHGEMLPAHAYPELKKYEHLKGNFGTAWQNQQKEFDNIPAPILFTTNCIMPVKDSYKDRVFTTAAVHYPQCTYIKADNNGYKDFTPVINKALELGGYKEVQKMPGINGGESLTVGFGHHTVLSVADKVVEAVKSGALKHIFLVGGCDGAKPGRNYYTEFVKQTPKNTLVLTCACGKYRFNDLELGDINGIPRLLDLGQCNDAYSGIKIAVELAKVFNCGVNDLPLSIVLSWYEQKAVCVLLTLLYLGIQNIKLGPSLPAFVSPNVLNVLVDKFKIAPTTTPEADLKEILTK